MDEQRNYREIPTDFDFFRWSRTGIALCILYVAFTALCLWGAQSAKGDVKGHVFMMQLPLAFQLDLLRGVGISTYGHSWTFAYIVLGSPMLVFLYLMDAAIGKVVRIVLAGMRESVP